ncbi:2-C-methyl-D-erythritol 4-phosphate cytidylyltransferase [bacterium]|nr:2-C-methyl-D-erythritol 4-phosphate cytidylyltransferase [bacterium]
MPEIKVIITAGGSSRRFGDENKLLYKINNKEVIRYSVDLFTEMNFQIIIPTNKDAIDDFQRLFKNYDNVTITEGGITRQQSVYKGLLQIGSCDYVIIHDGARPLITKEIVQEGINAVIDKRAIITAVKTTDTIKTVDMNKKITSTPNRINLINVQTPQIFDYKIILEAHKKYQDKSFTDDACLIEELGLNVFYIEGDYSNIKITNKIDIEYAKLIMDEKKC